jgi:hypothetical protein
VRSPPGLWGESIAEPVKSPLLVDWLAPETSLIVPPKPMGASVYLGSAVLAGGPGSFTGWCKA